MEFAPLPQSFYEPSAEVVGPLLLGHWLLRQTPGGVVGGPIVEVEAYLTDDPASHAFIGRTPRTNIMFGPPGVAYVYLIYGYHFCVNAVCHPEGRAEAVLIRAIEPLFGEERMRRNRKTAKATDLTNGPGKLCQAMKITRALNGANLCDADSPLFIAENPERAHWLAQRGPIVTTTRIGLTKAADRHLRYYADKSLFISRRARPVVAQTTPQAARSSRARKAQ